MAYKAIQNRESYVDYKNHQRLHIKKKRNFDNAFRIFNAT